MRLDVCGKRLVTLVDFRCSRIRVGKKLCRLWQKLNVSVSAVGGGTEQTCLRLESGHTVVIEALAGNPLGFDFLLGIEAIKALSSMYISKSVKAQFPPKPVSFCTASPGLSVEEPDFRAVFDQQ